MVVDGLFGKLDAASEFWASGGDFDGVPELWDEEIGVAHSIIMGSV